MVVNKIQQQPRAPDGGWGYSVVLGVALAFGLSGGLLLTDTLIYQAFIDRFNQSASATAWVFGLRLAMGFSFSPVASVCCRRFGVRRSTILGTFLVVGATIAPAFISSLPYIYITYGAIGGMGHSIVVTSCYLIIPVYFDKKLARANGISYAGIDVGGMVLGPLITVLFSEYGYTGSMIIIGGLMLNILVSAALFRPLVTTSKISILGQEEDEIEMTEGLKQSSKFDNVSNEFKQRSKLQNDQEYTTDDPSLPLNDIEILSQENNQQVSPKRCSCENTGFSMIFSRHFIGFCIACLGLSACASCNTFLASLARERHISKTIVALLLMVTAVTNCISRFMSGFLLDLRFIKERRIITLLIIEFLAGGTMCLFPLTSSIGAVFAVNISTNIFIAAFEAQQATLFFDVVGHDKMAYALGMARIFMGTGSLCGTVIGGVLIDWSGHYNAVYYFGGGIAVVCLVICFVLNITQIKTNPK